MGKKNLQLPKQIAFDSSNNSSHRDVQPSLVVTYDIKPSNKHDEFLKSHTH